MMRLTYFVRAALPAVLLAACATATAPTGPSPSASSTEPKLLQPLVVGWEQFFRIDWQAGERNGRPVVDGHVFNTWGEAATHVQLLVDELDAAGRITAQQVAWLGFDLTPGTSAPFEVALREPATAYRVSVFGFDWVERGRGPRLSQALAGKARARERGRRPAPSPANQRGRKRAELTV